MFLGKELDHAIVKIKCSKLPNSCWKLKQKESSRTEKKWTEFMSTNK